MSITNIIIIMTEKLLSETCQIAKISTSQIFRVYGTIMLVQALANSIVQYIQTFCKVAITQAKRLHQIWYNNTYMCECVTGNSTINSTAIPTYS